MIHPNSTPPMFPHHMPDFYRTARRKALGPNRSPPQWSRQRLNTPPFSTVNIPKSQQKTSFLGYLFPTRKNKKRESEVNFLKSLGTFAEGTSLPKRRVGVGTGRGSPKHLPRTPKKPTRKQRGIAPKVTAELGRFCWHQAAHLTAAMMDQWANGHMAREDFSRRQAAGGKQVGRRVLPISNFRGRKRQWPGESQREHWQPTLVEMTRHLNIPPSKRRAEICS